MRREDLKLMKQGSVIVDVAVDQGGCVETCRPTTHAEPTYTIDGVIHYCVANMPGAVARTSTFALNNATLAYGLKIADQGIAKAAQGDRATLGGINTYQGKCTHKAVAQAINAEYVPFKV